ncbi:MAG: endopeptidase La [Calditrichaeota bacterium]|nr:MAG: endopeptidase La [Calditrichota bacterium]MBL1206372.1 endopeptidase La [Calditrichota bacterium]NOG46198.1 endopeptidase La [Calditrichota bacterium]
MPLRNTVVFPHQVIPLAVGREKSLNLLSELDEETKVIGLVSQQDGRIEEPSFEDLYKFGTAAMILKKFKMPDGSEQLIVQGLYRFKVSEFSKAEPYFEGIVHQQEDNVVPQDQDFEIDALANNIKNIFQKIVDHTPYLTNEHRVMVLNTEDSSKLADVIASQVNFTVTEKEQILEMLDVKERLTRVNYLLNKELQILELGNKIQDKVQGELNKTQRHYYLREQLKAIKKELGEYEDEGTEIEELREKLTKIKMPKYAKDVAEKELNRLSKMSPMASEYTVTRTYLDWILDMPWKKTTKDRLNVSKAEAILNEDHYGLDKVKKRILEYLAVRQLKSDMKGPILCFVGPPGVGKTSLGRSIARALNRKFSRLSLGGVRDEAEIRGHRRTYVGALPGRIIQEIKKVGSNNPVFMLDELDKLGMDFRGDPSSALLEVLDPEQNFSFADHYLEIPFDLSKVMFIATANLIDPIPPALKDRMEIIELISYTEEEKAKIAEKYLIPKQLENHGLTDKQIQFTNTATKTVINKYTREAGVRNLEREIASIIRGIAKEIVEETVVSKKITPRIIPNYLGAERFYYDIAERVSRPGVATGLAWTPVGGDILFIEATKMEGKGNLSLTGKLGDVMKESASAALSFLRSNKDKFNINSKFYEKFDTHIHVPAGAIPKDGPSAGITMFSALYSLFSDRPIKDNLAMTGEITLRGLVLPVGGIKEKVLAAKRAGIKEIIIPLKNKKDLEEIPQHNRKDITFHFVNEVEELFKIAFK